MCNKPQSERGIAIIVTVITVALAMAIVLGLAIVYLNEVAVSESTRYSTVAIYAADSGIERALYKDRKMSGGLNPCPLVQCEPTMSLPNGASFKYFMSDQIDASSPTGTMRHIKSLGSFRGTNRSLEIFYPK